MRSALAVGLGVALALAEPGVAHAYLDGTRFAAPALEGGAGGRYFTGAPEDGYSCAVCHRGGGSAPLALEGVPALWDPGTTYELTLALPDSVRTAGANLEIADDAGRGQGTLEVIPDAELGDAERCRDGRPATTPVLIEGRLIARVEPCGARRARVRWTAPPMPRTDVRFFASAVTGNDSADPSGDGTSAFVVPFRARGAPDPSGAMLSQRCSIDHATRRRPGTPLALLALAALLARRRQRRSRSRENVAAR